MDCSGHDHSAGNASATSNGTTIASACSGKESSTEHSRAHRYSAISAHSLVTGTPQHIRAWLMSLPQDSPASRSRSRACDKARKTNVICGPRRETSFAWFDRESSSWKTSQACLLNATYSEFLATWPSAGLMRDGVCWAVTTPGRSRTAKECGLSLLRPTAQCWKAWTFRNIAPLVRRHHSDGNVQEQFARLFGRMITPESNEILMLWPEGWTDLKPLAMDRWQQWLSWRGEP